jgi:hypothetical protein
VDDRTRGQRFDAAGREQLRCSVQQDRSAFTGLDDLVCAAGFDLEHGDLTVGAAAQLACHQVVPDRSPRVLQWRADQR